MKGKFAAAIALLACFGSDQAQAVMLNPKGLGQALIYPYYTVNKNQDTYVSLVNTANIGKVVKVRFNEAYNGRAVLDFLVFLRANGVWTGAISQTGTGGAILRSGGNCTLPEIPVAGLAFSASGYANDGGPQGVTRTREGSIEIIAAGDIKPFSDTGQAVDTPGPFYYCPRLGYIDFKADLTTPSSGLAGYAAIVNVGEGTFFGYNADALTGFTDRVLLGPTSAPDAPSLADANSDESPLAARAYVLNDRGEPLALDFARGIDAVSAVFMAGAMSNDYLTDPGLGAHTDWVVTFPTKRFYVDKALDPAAPSAPFDAAFVAPGEAPVKVSATVFGRDGHTPACAQPECEMPNSSVALPYQVNTLSFREEPTTDASDVLGGRAPANIVAFPVEGWAQLRLAPQRRTLDGANPQSGSVALGGLPATGFMVYNVVNAQAQPGKLANYGGALPHRTQLACGASATSCPVP